MTNRKEWDDEALIAFYNTAMDALGDDGGTPVLAIDGHAIFGSIITSGSRGEEAGEFFDAAITLGNYPPDFELKR